MRKKLDENEKVLQKWPPIFRDGLRFTDHDLGIMDVMIQGKAEITPKDLKKMRKFGYIFEGICVFGHVDKSLKGNVNIQNEDDVSPFLMTLVAFRDYQAPPLENDGKSDEKVLKKVKPRRTETRHTSQESVHSGRTVSPDHDQGDDISR